MARVSKPIKGALLGAAWLLAAAPGQAQEGRHRWTFGAEAASMSVSTPLNAWPAGGLGKLRYDEGDDALDVTRASATLESRISPAWRAHVAATYESDSEGPGLTEAYLEWRPVPNSRSRQSVRVGAFYPPLSLENPGDDWSSPFTRSFSAINSWIAEELRTLGAEWSLRRTIGYAGSPSSFEVHAALVAGNDPTGTLLAWKGWSLHDRQTHLGEELPLAPLPQIQPGAWFEKQAPVAEPFVETDDRLGYYVGASFQQRRRMRIALTHYDNRADPRSVRRGQYGWRTEFDHAGAQFELPLGVGLIMQWFTGSTVMGPAFGGVHVVDVDAEAAFALLTRSWGAHRLSVRRDDFEAVDNDSTPNDANGETGDAWTLAWRYRHSARLSVAAEWLSVHSSRPARAYFGRPTGVDESRLSVGIELAFGNGP